LAAEVAIVGGGDNGIKRRYGSVWDSIKSSSLPQLINPTSPQMNVVDEQLVLGIICSPERIVAAREFTSA
jgi:hypothetical protein